MTNDYSSSGLKSLFLIESSQSLGSFYVSFDLVTNLLLTFTSFSHFYWLLQFLSLVSFNIFHSPFPSNWSLHFLESFTFVRRRTQLTHCSPLTAIGCFFKFILAANISPNSGLFENRMNITP